MNHISIAGVILDCGDTVTCTVPIYDGFLIESGVQQLDLGGREITCYILRPGFRRDPLVMSK